MGFLAMRHLVRLGCAVAIAAACNTSEFTTGGDGSGASAGKGGSGGKSGTTGGSGGSAARATGGTDTGGEAGVTGNIAGGGPIDETGGVGGAGGTGGRGGKGGRASGGKGGAGGSLGGGGGAGGSTGGDGGSSGVGGSLGGAGGANGGVGGSAAGAGGSKAGAGGSSAGTGGTVAGSGGSAGAVGGAGGSSAGVGGVAGSLGVAGSIGLAGGGGSGGAVVCESVITMTTGGWVRMPAHGGCWYGYGFTGADSSSNVTPQSFMTCASSCTFQVNGTLGKGDSSYAYLGFAVHQPIGSASKGTVTPTGTGIAIQYSVWSGVPVRLILAQGDTRWCKDLPAMNSSVSVPYGSFAQQCWDVSSGTPYAKQPIDSIMLEVLGNSSASQTYTLAINAMNEY
jgi:hypothetical protein